jgi:hypothetical protein
MFQLKFHHLNSLNVIFVLFVDLPVAIPVYLVARGIVVLNV